MEEGKKERRKKGEKERLERVGEEEKKDERKDRPDARGGWWVCNQNIVKNSR